MKGDSLDHFRQEYNQMLLSKVTGVSNSIVRERSITVTVAKRSIDEARVYFARVGTDLLTHLARLSSVGRELDLGERLEIFRAVSYTHLDVYKRQVSPLCGTGQL